MKPYDLGPILQLRREKGSELSDIPERVGTQSSSAWPPGVCGALAPTAGRVRSQGLLPFGCHSVTTSQLR